MSLKAFPTAQQPHLAEHGTPKVSPRRGGRAQQTCSLLSEQNGDTLHVVRDTHRKPKPSLNTACPGEWLLTLCVNTHTLGTYQNKKQNSSCTMGHWRTQKIPVGGVLSLLAYAMLGFSCYKLLQAKRTSKFYELCKREFMLSKGTSYCADDRYNAACNVPGRPIYFPKTAGNGNWENKEISKAGLNPQGLSRAAWKAIFVCWSKCHSTKNRIFFR